MLSMTVIRDSIGNAPENRVEDGVRTERALCCANRALLLCFSLMLAFQKNKLSKIGVRRQTQLTIIIFSMCYF